MKAYKITLLFIDHDNVGPASAQQLIEDARLPNHISPGHVMALEERDIGEWYDEHPLNNYKTHIAAYQNLFMDPAPVIGIPGERAFYDLMQTYRNAPVSDQKAVTAAYEAVKDHLRKHRV